MERIVRIPQQKRSIEKKNKILDAAYIIFNTKGYYNTSTAEIAVNAGISTGSLYAYFKDKKELFIEIINKFTDKLLELMIIKFEEIPENKDISVIISSSINMFVESHEMSKKLHEEIMALSHLDEEIRILFIEQRKRMINEISKQFKKRQIIMENEQEKLFIMYLTIDSICNEFIYDNKTGYDKNTIINECAVLLKKLIS